MNLNDVGRSPQLFARLGELARRFVDGHIADSPSPRRPNWLRDFPRCIGQLHSITTRWVGILGAHNGTVGQQDRVYLPPQPLKDGGYIVVEENQKGFQLCVEERDSVWTANRIENSESTLVESLAGYLVSFTLQEMVMASPLWAVDECFEGLNRDMLPDLTLVWSDSINGGYFPRDDLRYYWHRAGALVVGSSRGRFDVGTYDLSLQEYFERFGLYDIR